MKMKVKQLIKNPCLKLETYKKISTKIIGDYGSKNKKINL